MTRENYLLLENYMLSCMGDSAHDKEHIYRVLYCALEIARAEGGADMDVVIAACLLHDIGRKEQFLDPSLCHARVGGEKAYAFLTEKGFDPAFAARVRSCIRSHRYRKDCPPDSLEAKILFDADKLDVAGAVGVARTLIYQGEVGEPIYSLLSDGTPSPGDGDKYPSFFQEYKFKLEKLYDCFFTPTAARMAKERREIARQFYRALLEEVSSSYVQGKEELEKLID